MNRPLEDILQVIAQTLVDKKGMNLLALDVRGVCGFTEAFVIAEGTVDRHVQALSSTVQERLKEMGIQPYRVEGEGVGDWIVLDYMEVIIHLFTPAMRDKYRLEELWKEGKCVPTPEVHICAAER